METLRSMVTKTLIGSGLVLLAAAIELNNGDVFSTEAKAALSSHQPYDLVVSPLIIDQKQDYRDGNTLALVGCLFVGIGAGLYRPEE
jgi:hypothetical protein